jgi:hypothetical protein
VHEFAELAMLCQRRADRLMEVRCLKLERAKQAALGHESPDGDWEAAVVGRLGRDADLFSEASTVRSRTSHGSSHGSQHSRKSSSKSSRGQRRHEAKKFSLKEGGVFEEEALLHELARIAQVVTAAGPPLGETFLAAVELELAALAARAQAAYEKACAAVASAVARAWQPAAMRATWLVDVGASNPEGIEAALALFKRWQTGASAVEPSLQRGGPNAAEPLDEEWAERPMKPKLPPAPLRLASFPAAASSQL